MPQWFAKNEVRVWPPDWQMCGQSDKVCEKWMRPIITKVLINTRWRLNQLIDNNGGKPADVDPEHWKTLVAMRTTEAAQMKSDHMRSISKGKGSTTAQMKAIEREVVSRLVCIPTRYVATNVEVDVMSVHLCQHTLSVTFFVTAHVWYDVYLDGFDSLTRHFFCYEVLTYAMIGVVHCPSVCTCFHYVFLIISKPPLHYPIFVDNDEKPATVRRGGRR
jgi:hypothetical protein